jgi:murein DD-endopeptidase MepM/ murein hydrolase activator NlpD
VHPGSTNLRIDYRDRSKHARPRKHWILLTISAVVLATTATVVRLTATPASTPVGPPVALTTASLGAAPGAASATEPSIPLQIDLNAQPATAGLGLDSIEVIVRSNDTLDRIFRRLELDLSDLASMRELPGLRDLLDGLRPGDQITVTKRDGALEGLVRPINESQTLTVTRGDGGFEARIIENPIETQIARQRVRIDSSLFEAANEAGVSDQTALMVATIFGWDVDFVLDVREGDEFTVVYEKIYQDGEYLRDGPVIAAEFINDGKIFRAVRYVLPDGRAEYFTPEGRSMHRAFLRAPVDFTRVSSRFNPRRQHPILNRLRAHNGVDYAAPVGTPVRAAGDGRVRFCGVKGGYGRVIEIEHGGSITTVYGHLSRFARGMSAGKRVEQGNVIAYVGATGLATGPHLHYEYRLNGIHRNPQTVMLPAAAPITPELREDFSRHAAPLVAELELTKSTTLLAGR